MMAKQRLLVCGFWMLAVLMLSGRGAGAQSVFAVGRTSPGDTAYAPGIMRNAGRLMLDDGRSNIRCVLVDESREYAYCASDAAVGRILKVRLADLACVATLQLNRTENYLECGAIDAAGGYAYFFARGYNGRNVYPTGAVVKVRLSDFTRVGALDMNIGDYNHGTSSAMMDATVGVAYFLFTGGARSVLITIRLSDFSVLRRQLVSYDSISPSFAGIDSAGGYGYFCSSGIQGVKLIKMRLADLALAGGVTLNNGQGAITSADYDLAGGFGYFCHGDTGGGIVNKVRLKDMTVISTLTLTGGAGPIGAMALDTLRGNLYLVSQAGELIQVRLLDFRKRGSLKLNGTFGTVPTITIDKLWGNALISNGYASSQLINVRLSELTQTGMVTLRSGTDESWPRSSVIDAARGYAYFGSGTATVARVRLGDFTHTDGLQLNAGEGPLASAVIDTAGGFAYFGTATSPGKVIKVRLSDFKRVGALTLNAGENNLTSAVIDPAHDFAYFGTNTSPGRVVQVRLSDMKRRGALTLNAGENVLGCAVIDTVRGEACFGTGTWPGIVVKIRLATFQRVGALTLLKGDYNYNTNSGTYGENCLLSAVFDPTSGHAYFGTLGVDEWQRPGGSVVKVRVADMTRVGSITLGARAISHAAIDPTHGKAYFVFDDQHFHDWERSGAVVQVNLADFEISDGYSFYNLYSYTNYESSNLHCAVVDPAAGYAYLGTDGYDGGVVYRMALALKDTLHANRVTMSGRGAIQDVRFYSHAAKGNVRLAIYSDETSKTLLWESGPVKNTVAGGWLAVPVASGTPGALTLNPGKYWLAWQCDATESVASWAKASSYTEGFEMEWPFGPFLKKIDPSKVRLSSDQWSEYLTYGAVK